MAPEIVNKTQYSFPADIWALGILLFKVLTSAFPFRGVSSIFIIGSDDKDLYRKINTGKIEFPSTFTAQAKTLVQKMLRINQNERPSAKEVILIIFIKIDPLRRMV
jgi:serine/threonine protein kinase